MHIGNVPLTPGQGIQARHHERFPRYRSVLPASGSIVEGICRTFEELLGAKGAKVPARLHGKLWIELHRQNADRGEGLRMIKELRQNVYRLMIDLNGAPGEIRTPDLLIRSQSLYPAELRAHTKWSLAGPTPEYQGSPGGAIRLQVLLRGRAEGVEQGQFLGELYPRAANQLRHHGRIQPRGVVLSAPYALHSRY